MEHKSDLRILAHLICCLRGDGLTTFNLPDLRGVDSGRVLGSEQGEALKSHSHGINTLDVSNTAAFTINDHSGDMIVSTDNCGGWLSDGYCAYGEYNKHSYATNSFGDSETRPRNIALLACIKY